MTGCLPPREIHRSAPVPLLIVYIPLDTPRDASAEFLQFFPISGSTTGWRFCQLHFFLRRGIDAISAWVDSAVPEFPVSGAWPLDSRRKPLARAFAVIVGLLFRMFRHLLDHACVCVPGHLPAIGPCARGSPLFLSQFQRYASDSCIFSRSGEDQPVILFSTREAFHAQTLPGLCRCSIDRYFGALGLGPSGLSGRPLQDTEDRQGWR